MNLSLICFSRSWLWLVSWSFCSDDESDTEEEFAAEASASKEQDSKDAVSSYPIPKDAPDTKA